MNIATLTETSIKVLIVCETLTETAIKVLIVCETYKHHQHVNNSILQISITNISFAIKL